jgi:hypothetical protein
VRVPPPAVRQLHSHPPLTRRGLGLRMGRRGLGAVWWGMVTFFVLRLIQHGVHVVAHWERHPLTTSMRRAIRVDTLHDDL